MEQERAYWTHEVAERLEIGDSTLRKWCLALEEQSYIFTKGEQESRAFLEKDIVILERMKESIRGRKKSMKQAAIIALETDRTTLVQEKQENNGTTLVPDAMDYIAVALEERDKEHELHMRQQEQRFAEKMQQVLSEQLALQEKTLTANLTAKFNRLEESNKRIEDYLTAPKKPFWKFW